MSTANKKAYTRTEGEYEALERQLAEAMSMLDNVWYWEGCPDDYKKRIEQLKDKI